MEDKRLERLYDYTKFHIGIYLSAAGALTAAIGFLAEESKASALAPYVDKPLALLAAVFFMFSAGACGGTVASSLTECDAYTDFWDVKHGPFGSKLLKGKHWAALEHGFFWLSVAAAAFAVLSSAPVVAWLQK